LILWDLEVTSQDLCEVHIRDPESWCSVSYKSLYRLGHSILKTPWVHTYKYTLYTLDNLHLECTFDNLYNSENNDYMLDVSISSDARNNHLGLSWHLFRNSQEIYAVSTQIIREHFDTTLGEGNHKPMCTEAILWDPDFSKYHLLHNELQTAQLL
jgi:hypothetical protein